MSIDEMMVRFTGRSLHTYRQKAKPIKEGYKIYALYDYGYIWTFIPSSRGVDNNKEIKKVTGLNDTANLVLHLANQLPSKIQAFHVYMDNYFSGIPLFKHLRSIGIGACGTVRTNTMQFPEDLKTDKNKYNWNTTSGVIVDEVLALLWIDNTAVTMLTTIHELLGPEWKIKRDRRRPRINNVNKARVQDTWGNSHTKNIEILKVIDDYNHHMGGVDIADQRRMYYNTQIATRRNWFPLFFWLLDTAIVNSYLVCKTAGSKADHNDSRLELAWDLIKMAREMEKGKRNLRRHADADEELPEPPPDLPSDPDLSDMPRARHRVTKHSEDLNPSRLLPGNHFPTFEDKCMACVWCRIQAKAGKITIKKQNPPESSVICLTCDAVLCLNQKRNCFTEYHTLDE